MKFSDLQNELLDVTQLTELKGGILAPGVGCQSKFVVLQWNQLQMEFAQQQHAHQEQLKCFYYLSSFFLRR